MNPNIYDIIRKLILNHTKSMTEPGKYRLVLGEARRRQLIEHADTANLPDGLRTAIWMKGLDALPTLFGVRIDYDEVVASDEALSIMQA